MAAIVNLVTYCHEKRERINQAIAFYRVDEKNHCNYRECFG